MAKKRTKANRKAHAVPGRERGPSVGVRAAGVRISGGERTGAAARAERKPGRPTIFTDDLATLITDRLAAGESLEAICREEGMPSASTIRRWRSESPSFQSIYARAREDQGEHQGMKLVEIAEQMREVARKVEAGKMSAETARAVLDALAKEGDARKWAAARMSRGLFGDRAVLEHQGAAGGPLEIVLSRPEESNLA